LLNQINNYQYKTDFANNDESKIKSLEEEINNLKSQIIGLQSQISQKDKIIIQLKNMNNKPGFYGGNPDAFNQGFNGGFNQNFGQGFFGGFNGGFNQNFGQGFNQGFNSEFNQGFFGGFNPGFNQNFNQGFNQGFNQNFYQGFNQNFNQENYNGNFNDTFNIKYCTCDGSINDEISCQYYELFCEVEERIYQKYQQLRFTNNSFIGGGKIIDKMKTIQENQISPNSKIIILNN